MIISIHIRKCAGTSFRKSLALQYKERLLLDYGDEIGSSWPSSIIKRQLSSITVKNNVQKLSRDFDIIHGHFLRDKYDFLGKDNQYISFMRHPVQRVLSNYFYLKRNVNRRNPDALIVNQLGFSLEEFAKHPDNRNLQTRYLQSQSLKEFKFVGVTEFYNESISELKRIVGVDIPIVDNENINYNSISEYEVSEESIKVIEQCNQEDIRLYNIALDRLHK